MRYVISQNSRATRIRQVIGGMFVSHMRSFCLLSRLYHWSLRVFLLCAFFSFLPAVSTGSLSSCPNSFWGLKFLRKQANIFWRKDVCPHQKPGLSASTAQRSADEGFFYFGGVGLVGGWWWLEHLVDAHLPTYISCVKTAPLVSWRRWKPFLSSFDNTDYWIVGFLTPCARTGRMGRRRMKKFAGRVETDETGIE